MTRSSRVLVIVAVIALVLLAIIALTTGRRAPTALSTTAARQEPTGQGTSSPAVPTEKPGAPPAKPELPKSETRSAPSAVPAVPKAPPAKATKTTTPVEAAKPAGNAEATRSAPPTRTSTAAAPTKAAGNVTPSRSAGPATPARRAQTATPARSAGTIPPARVTKPSRAAGPSTAANPTGTVSRPAAPSKPATSGTTTKRTTSSTTARADRTPSPSRTTKPTATARKPRPTTAPSTTKSTPAQPLSPGKFVTIPNAPHTVKTYLIAGVTPIYTDRGVRVESFRSPTDTILLVQLDPTKNIVRTLSLPRDTLLGTSGSRLNSVLPRLGADALVRTITSMTGVRIDAYVLVNLRGVRDMTDAAGGVMMNVHKAMKYDDYAGQLHINFQPGRQLLSGQKAEEFLRFRHDARGDIGRIDRTRDFLAALAVRLFTPDGLERLPRVSAAIRANSRTTLTDADYQNILGFALRRPTLQTFVLPGHLSGPYWRVDNARATSVLTAFRSTARASR